MRETEASTMRDDDYAPEWMFHIFTNGRDEFTTDILKAIRWYKRFVKENDCARLYLEVMEDRDDVNPMIEDCLLSKGEYPS